MLISAIVFISIDFIYLNVMKGYFDKQIQAIQGSKIELNLLGAALCYIFLIYGLNYFIIKLVYNNCNYGYFMGWFIICVDHIYYKFITQCSLNIFIYFNLSYK